MTTKPVIFISYSHKDEPQHPKDGEVQWLSFVRTYLQPAIKQGVFELFLDEHILGGSNLEQEIERKLRACDIFLLLLSANSAASDYILDIEVKITRERERQNEDVVLYPLFLSPTPKVALDKFKDKVIRPRDARPLSGFPFSERIQQMTDIADELAAIAAGIVSRKPAPPTRVAQPPFAYIAGLPETPYERLVGREIELKRLDGFWEFPTSTVISLVAEGGTGKSALVNEWLRALQVDGYRGAEAVLGWSFYSQGSKERATSADEFLDWALRKLDIPAAASNPAVRAEFLADTIAKRRVLLILDGVEPMLHGPGNQIGQLKDLGLRTLLRRVCTNASRQMCGLIVVTSRIAVKDIAPWVDSTAPVIYMEELHDEAGAVLLRDNGVWGTDIELKDASRDFGGHPLALSLLASFLKETKTGGILLRDRIRAFSADAENPRYDHARRVMESYERDWLSRQPVLLAVMQLVGLFDRPATEECLRALRAKPEIQGLTEPLVDLDDEQWVSAIERLREVHLLAPPDLNRPNDLDAHPLVREWFGHRLRRANENAWTTAHTRLYDHLRSATKEGETPSLQDLAPLYQFCLYSSTTLTLSHPHF